MDDKTQLKELRVSTGKSQAEFCDMLNAERAYVSLRSYQEYERGRKVPPALMFFIEAKVKECRELYKSLGLV